MLMMRDEAHLLKPGSANGKAGGKRDGNNSARLGQKFTGATPYYTAQYGTSG
jgi:hypothetical protein